MPSWRSFSTWMLALTLLLMRSVRRTLMLDTLHANRLTLVILLLLIPHFVCSRFACWTPENLKILFSLYGVTRTYRMTWRNPFGHQSAQSAFFNQNDQMPLVSPRFDQRPKRGLDSCKTIFFIVLRQTRASRRFLNKFDPKSILGGPKTLILIQLLEWVEAKAIVKIIQFSFQRLFMGRN